MSRISPKGCETQRGNPAEYFAGDPRLVACWPLTENFNDAVPRRDEIVGPDLLEGHGSFSVDGDGWWTAIGAGWTIAGGVASFNAGTFNSIYKDTIITSDKYYKVTYKVSAVTGTGVRVRLGTVGYGLVRPAAGTYTEYFKSTGSTMYLDCYAGTCTVDNLTIQEVFTFGVGGNHLISADVLNGHGDFEIATDPFFTLAFATISGGALNISSAGTATGVIFKTSVVTIGRYYDCTFTVTDYTEGAINPRLGSTGTGQSNVSAVGTYTQRLLCGGTPNLNFDCTGKTTLKVDNVTVREVFPGRFTNNGCLLIGSCLQSTRPMNLNTQKLTFIFEVGNMVPSILQNIISHEYAAGEVGGWAFGYYGPGGNYMVELAHRGEVGYGTTDLWNHGLGTKLSRMFAGIIDTSRTSFENALYVDGSLPAPGNLTRSADSNNTIVMGNSPIFIGGYGGVANIVVQMIIKNVAIFNGVLSAEEIADYTAWARDVRRPMSSIMSLATFSGRPNGTPVRGVDKEIR